jgi:copper chaperone
MEKQFKIEGMSCNHCVMAVEKELEKLELVTKSVEIGLVKVEFNPEQVNEEQIVDAIKEAGFKIAD